MPGNINVKIKNCIVVLLAALFFTISFTIVHAQDPGLQDSLIVGNLDGSPLYTDIAQPVSIPVWVKTDDSVTFFHLPLATQNDYVTFREGGEFFPPMNLWDDADFLAPNNNYPSQGWTNQSLLGFAFTSPPRDPQNFLYTDYQWVHVADFHIVVTGDPTVYGDTSIIMEGFSPFYGPLMWGLPDGVTQFPPGTIYSKIIFVSNLDPVISQPPDGAVYNINNQLPFTIEVIATDGDVESIQLTVDFDGSNYQFTDLEIYPGYARKRFSWLPRSTDTGTYTASFTANDGVGGIDVNTITLNVETVALTAATEQVLRGSDVIFPISLDNSGITSYLGGFEMLLRYDEPLLCLTGVSSTERLADWEYFHYELEDNSLVRIVGLADISGVGEYLPPGDGPIVNLHFTISDDIQYEGMYGWVQFISNDNNDNTVADSTGYYLIRPDLQDGWLHVVDPDSILMADINLNLQAWEISDAVLFSTYLIDPINHPLSPLQLMATDCNGDHIVGSFPDFIYLLRVILGEGVPPKVAYGMDISAVVSLNQLYPDSRQYNVKYDCDIPAGGVLMRINHGDAVIPEIIPSSGLTTEVLDRDGVLSVMIYSYDGDLIMPGSELFSFDTEADNFDAVFSELQVSDMFGYFIPSSGRVTIDLPLEYKLNGAYPNPFNASTVISFSLPEVSDIQLSVFNILGQQVKTFKADNMSPGENTFIWDGTNDNGQPVASGVYMYLLQANDFSATSRMVLLK